MDFILLDVPVFDCFFLEFPSSGVVARGSCLRFSRFLLSMTREERGSFRVCMVAFHFHKVYLNLMRSGILDFISSDNITLLVVLAVCFTRSKSRGS
jgi:hypothetical protein